MSAPDTNTEKQEDRHKTPLMGIWIGMGAVLLLLVVFIFFNIAGGETPEGADEQVDGRTGEVETVAPVTD